MSLPRGADLDLGARSRAPARIIALLSSAGRFHSQPFATPAALHRTVLMLFGTVARARMGGGHDTRRLRVGRPLPCRRGATRPGPPSPCRRGWAESQTSQPAHTCARTQRNTQRRGATPICCCAALRLRTCRSTGHDCPSRPASADQPDALFAFAYLL